MEKNLVIDRSALPQKVLEWLEADQNTSGIFSFREESGKIVLERLANVDPVMLARVRADIERYRSALQRLADS